MADALGAAEAGVAAAPLPVDAALDALDVVDAGVVLPLPVELAAVVDPLDGGFGEDVAALPVVLVPPDSGQPASAATDDATRTNENSFRIGDIFFLSRSWRDRPSARSSKSL